MIFDFDNVDYFSTKIAANEEVLDDSNEDGDVNVVCVFTFNSNRDFDIVEFTVITFFMMIAILVDKIGIFCALKSTFPHRNHRLLVAAGMIAWFELVISRYLVFLFQYTKTSDQTSSSLLFWAAIFRYHYMNFGVLTLLSITVERALATFWLTDYEKKSRIWIPILLICLNNLISTIYAFFSVYQFVMMKFLFANTLFMTVFSILILEIIFFRNRKKLASLNKNNKLVQYTLSIRYQLQENVQTCKLIRPGVITIGILIIIIILTECLPVILDFPDIWRARCNLVFDTMTHINALIVAPSVTFLMDGYRRVFVEMYQEISRKVWKKRPNSNGEVARRKSIFSFPKVSSQNEGDVYFEMFNKTARPQTLSLSVTPRK